MCVYIYIQSNSNSWGSSEHWGVSPERSVVGLWKFCLHQTQTCEVKKNNKNKTLSCDRETSSGWPQSSSSPGKMKMKQAASPPIREMTRPMSGMKRARTSVTTNQIRVCRILLLLSRRTHTSTCSPWKRSHSPSITALGWQEEETQEWGGGFKKICWEFQKVPGIWKERQRQFSSSSPATEV